MPVPATTSEENRDKMEMNKGVLGGFGKYDGALPIVNVSRTSESPVDREDDEESNCSVPDSMSDDQIELDMDVDKLVLSIREKLQMVTSPTDFWKENSPNNFTSSCSEESEDYNSYIHSPRMIPHHHRRRLLHPYSHQSSGSKPLSGTLQHARSRRRRENSLCWANSKSFNDIRRSNNRAAAGAGSSGDDPYLLLQQLLDSGSLIKEAVKRLNRNRKQALLSVGNSNNSSTTTSTTQNSSSSNTITKKFYRDDDAENSYPPLPMSAP